MSGPLRAAIVRAARRVREGGTVPRGTRPGDGFVFDRLRTYVEGDDPRRIDWSASARIGALQTRVYVEETILVLAAIVDESPSMRVGRRRSLASAADEAVRAWFGALENADRARRIVDDRVIDGRRAAVEARGRGPFDLCRSLALAVRALPLGSSLLAITDGFDLRDEPEVDALLARAAQRFDATVLLADDPWREGLPVRGFARFRDAESGRTRRLFIGRRARERYVRASEERFGALRARFVRARWRVGRLDERDGVASLERTLGVS